jgi:heavy metal response regulator
MRVLVVEDEEKIARFIQRGLKEEGYAVDMAKDGDEGHFMATTNEYDVILLDIMLPKRNGYDLCKKLREENVKVPVIFLSVKDEVKDKVRGLDAGADDYLVKPFAFEELLARVRANLRRKPDGSQMTYTVGDLTLDVTKREALRAGKTISLTAREYAMLEYFMRNAGQVVTRTMLSEHVWDVYFDTSSNVIDVYVNYLRAKIDDGHKVKLIHTVRGSGYMMKG